MNPSFCSALKARWLLCVPPSLEFRNSKFCTQSEFMWFVCISDKKKTSIFLCNFNHTIFIRSAVCLLRGTSWMFKYSSGLIQVFKGLSILNVSDLFSSSGILYVCEKNILMNRNLAILIFASSVYFTSLFIEFNNIQLLGSVYTSWFIPQNISFLMVNQTQPKCVGGNK
jgi:hypothetical protein